MTPDSKTYHRKSIRLLSYDYSSTGAYFVTICTQNRKCLFGEIMEADVNLNEIGKMVLWHWRRIPHHFPNVKLDKKIVMPNHIHGIIWISDDDVDVGAKHSKKPTLLNNQNCLENASPLQDDLSRQIPIGTKPQALSAIVQNFKSVTSRKFNRMRLHDHTTLWQRNYFDRIVRDEDELKRIREYIIYNPLKWESDKENPANW